MRRIWVPAEQLADEARRVVCGTPEDVEFKTKPQLAKEIVADMVADRTMPPWFAGDEVYGRSRELRDYIAAQGAGYVLRAGCDFSSRGDTRDLRTRGCVGGQALDDEEAAETVADPLGAGFEGSPTLRLGMGRHRQRRPPPAHP